MAVSTVPAVLDYLVGALRQVLAGVEVFDGGPITVQETDTVCIGYAPEGESAVENTLTPGGIASAPDLESYDIRCQVSAWRSGGTPKDARDRAFELVDAIAREVARDQTLGGNAGQARFSTQSLEPTQSQQGAVATVWFTVSVKAYTGARGGASLGISTVSPGGMSAGSVDSILQNYAQISSVPQLAGNWLYPLSAYYGARGDGVFDDTSAFARVAADHIATGRPIWVSPGYTYSVSSWLFDYSGVSQGASGPPYGIPGPVIAGGGRGSKIVQRAGTANGTPLLKVIGKTGTNAGAASNGKVTGTRIRGLDLVGQYTGGVGGNPSGVDGGDGIQFQSCFDLSIQDVFTYGFPGNGITGKRQYFDAGVNDEFAFDISLRDVRSYANGGWGVQLGDSTGAAIAANLDNVETSANRLGGRTYAPVNLIDRGGYSGANGGPGVKSVWTNQAPGAPQDVSNTADLVLFGLRCEQNAGPGRYEFDLEGGAGTSMFGCIAYATAGAHCIGYGVGQTGTTMQRLNVSGGVFSGDGITPGQKAFTSNTGAALTTALPSGVATTSIVVGQPLTIGSGVSVSVDNGTTIVVFTTSSAITLQTTIPVNSQAPGVTLPIGSHVYFSSNEGSNPALYQPRVEYGTFNGSRTLPSQVSVGNNIHWFDHQTLMVTPQAYLQFPREITTPGNAPTDAARLYIKDNGAGKTQLAARFPTGAEVVIATEP